MTIIPVRELAKFGVITDMDPYDLPPQAWSFGVNVRFRNGKVSRAPVFRAVQTLSAIEPRTLVAANPATGLDYLFIGYLNGQVHRIATGGETDYSVAAFTPIDAEATWTNTTLGGVVYVNRADRDPWALLPGASSFIKLANWNAAWTSQLLRTCGGALVALNVIKSGVSYPTLVKTSSIPTSGAVPVSWDQTSPSTLATENILADMSGPIIDATPFGAALAIYGAGETWLMTPDGTNGIYSYRKLPFRKGAINANCSIQIDGKHLVFGPDDIWTHDGFTEQSLVNGVVRDFIYQGLNLSRASKCFVTHNPKLKEIHFCYVSGDRGVAFNVQTNGCNRQAVYNYGSATPTWTFDDLPCVHSGDNVNLDTAATYANTTQAYATVGSSYLDQEDGFKRSLCYVGAASATYALGTKLYAFDVYGPGSSVLSPVDAAATRPVQLEKDGIDLDGLSTELTGYKTVTAVIPQGRLDIGSAPLVFTMGSADYFGGPTIYDTTQTYDGQELYKLDYRSSGRYLGLKMSYSDIKPFSLSGLDYDFHSNGGR